MGLEFGKCSLERIVVVDCPKCGAEVEVSDDRAEARRAAFLEAAAEADEDAGAYHEQKMIREAVALECFAARLRAKADE